MKVWWSTSPKPGNFGDVLTPIIFAHYGIKHEWATLGYADAISTGSIIRLAGDGVHVYGSGAISHKDRINPKAVYHWVRGPLTAELVRKHEGNCPDIYGDPAMLLPRVFKRTVQPTKEVGIFPHYVDLGNCQGEVISPLQRPAKVLQKLWQYERIISSSLHGIIAAHAYGIPAAWVKLGGKLTGDDIKFHDHAMSVGLPEMPLSTIYNPVFTLPKYNDAQIHSILKGLGGH